MKTSKPMRIHSLVVLMAILAQTLYPTAAMALADSPDQPEFQSFEDFNATDMVDLISGDFVYNIPLLNVPSPEGGYQVPLTYHAGIELNEEAGWVGLGWSLNAGAIHRDVSMFPDDFSGEGLVTSISNPGTTGSVDSYPFVTHYFDSQKGTGGTVSLLGIHDFGWGTQKHFGFAPAGLTLKDGKITYDYNYMLAGNLASGELAASIYGGELFNIFQTAASVGSSIMDQVTGSAKSSDVSIFAGWHLAMSQQEGDFLSKGESYHYYLKDQATNQQYGTLYLGKAFPEGSSGSVPHQLVNVINGPAWPTGGPGTGPKNAVLPNVGPNDGNQARSYRCLSNPLTDTYYPNPSPSDANSNYPTSLAYDNFNVAAPGVAGVIKPYRQDFGSCITSSAMNDVSSDPFLGPRFRDDIYKVQFKYHGDFSNSYTFHYMSNGNNDMENEKFPYDFDNSNTGSGVMELKVNFKDPKIYVNYDQNCFNSCGWGAFSYNPLYDQSAQIEQPRNGLVQRNSLVNSNLLHGKNIEWYTNSEIIAGTAKSSGFMDSDQGYNRTGLPSNGIGGFSITNEAGMTYHFSIPVYNKTQSLVSNDFTTSPATTYVLANNNPYASTWLLTGITGPDFVDRGTVGIIDSQDWGYWVQLDYGKFASGYGWRNPYYGSNIYTNISYTYQYGTKETYYLDKIATRSHTALFSKSLKYDGKGSYKYITGGSLNTYPSSSLRLDDIYVLQNSDYQRLISAAPGGGGLTTNSTAYNSELQNGDTYQNVLDNHDIAAGSVQSFLSVNQLQNIHFNYSYQLCPTTINSFDMSGGTPAPYDADHSTPSITSGRSGKLTLTSVDILGKSGIRFTPNYLFDYNGTDPVQNPSYNPYQWDGSGMYKSGGSGQDNLPHNPEKQGDQWCLKKITTPTGAEIDIQYEKDDYGSLNGYPLITNTSQIGNAPLKLGFVNGSVSGSSITLLGDNIGTTMLLTDLIGPGQVATVQYFSGAAIHTFTATISSISGNVVTLSAAIPSAVLEFAVYVPKKYGGGVRVASITTKDEINSYQTKYIYSTNGVAGGPSSGVASFEPAVERSQKGDFPFYSQYDHPVTTILYSNVSVINGRYDNTFTETSKKAFHFVTPHHDYLKVAPTLVYPTAGGTGEFTPGPGPDYYYGRWGCFTTIDRTSVIGSVDSIKEYNRFNNLTGKTVFNYTDNSDNAYGNNMGMYTENTVLWESIATALPGGNHNFLIRFFQSYGLKKPNILKSVTTTKDRFVTKHEIATYDYLTGQALATKITYGGSEVYRDSVTPAYKFQTSLAFKAADLGNKNIMTAPGETFSYVYDKNHVKQLLGATATVWSSLNSYRDYQTSSGSYVSQPGASTTMPYSGNNVFLPLQTYTWKSRIDENGTVNAATFVPFNWTGTPDSKWVQTSKVDLYDHYSHPLQTQGIPTIGSAHGSPSQPSIASRKLGYNNSFEVGACANAKYTAWCYSGAEDKSLDGNNYYSGEVLGSNDQYTSSTYAHTGSCCSRMAPWDVGFSYRVNISDLPNGYQYRGKYGASVWIHQNGMTAAYLSCSAYDASNKLLYTGATYQNQGPLGTSTNGTIEQAGNWYLFNYVQDLSAIFAATSYLIFSVQNTGAAAYAPYVYADDFRVFPLSSPITGKVFDPKSGNVTATLGPDNYATKYEYDGANKLRYVYKETKLGFTRVSATTYNFNR